MRMCQQQQIAKCQLEARHANQSLAEREREEMYYVPTCMAAARYKFTVLPKECTNDLISTFMPSAINRQAN